MGHNSVELVIIIGKYFLSVITDRLCNEVEWKWSEIRCSKSKPEKNIARKEGNGYDMEENNRMKVKWRNIAKRNFWARSVVK